MPRKHTDKSVFCPTIYARLLRATASGLFSLFVALVVSATAHVERAWAEPFSIVSLSDVNGSGSPEVSVLMQDSVDGKNYAYVVDAGDGALINSVLFGDGFTIPDPISQAALPDINGNGADEIAMLGVRPDDGAVVVLINDASTGAWIQTLGFDADYPPVAMAVVPDMNGNGISEIAVLGVRVSDGKVMVLIKDASTNGWIPSLTLDANYPPVAMKVVEYASGAVGIAVLGVNPVDGNVKVVIRDVSTRNKIGNAIYFGSNFPPVDMTIVPDINGNSEPEIAVLGVNSTDGKVRVLIKDASSGARVNAVFFSGDYSPIAMAVLPDINGSGSPEIALLGVNSTDSAVRVLVKDASSGGWIKTLGFGSNYSPVGMTVVPDIDGSGSPEIAVLVVNSANGKLEVVIKDAFTDTPVNNIRIPSSRVAVCDNSVPQVDVNSTVDGFIETAYDYNYYRIEILSSGLLTVYTTGDTNTYGYLKDPDCNTIATGSILGYYVDAGTYYVYVRSSSGGVSYTLNVEFLDGATEDHGDDCPSATPLDVNSTVDGILELEGDSDYFRIEVPSSRLLMVYTTSDTNTYGYLKDSSCNTIATDDDSGEGYNFRIGYYVDAGTYYVAVSSYYSDTGSYTLNVELVIPTPFTDVAAIAAGSIYNMALKTDGSVWAWGDNRYGQLGDGTTTDSYVPLQVCAYGETAPCSSWLTGVIAIAGGRNSDYYIAHSMALKTDGTVWAWGNNEYGQLGTTTTETCRSRLCSTTPVQVNGLTGVTAIAAGNLYSMAVKTDGTVWAWGWNYYGQLGDGTTTNSATPVQVCAEGETAPCSSFLTGVSAITGGGRHSVAFKTDGTVWAWGYNYYGQLGDGTRTNSYVPVQVNGLADVVGIAAGNYYSIALKTDGTVWAWGRNRYGQLGAMTTETCGTYSSPCSTTPVQADSLTNVAAIAGGDYHSMAVKTDDTIWAWGLNSTGQLGATTTETCDSYYDYPCSTTPLQADSLTDVVGIAAGWYHSIAFKTDGSVWAWGNNSYGQLGDGTKDSRSTPVQVINNPWLP